MDATEVEFVETLCRLDQADASLGFFRSSGWVDRCLAAVKEIQILQILRDIYQNQVLDLGVLPAIE